jgi:predicted dehydrogenase/threonine dehydrogenase-like Zn-dependent dehydrogenase
MKQLVQSLRTGEVSLLDVPRPQVGPGEVLVQVHASLLSSGTERAMADFAGKSLLGKARARPDLVKQVVAKARQEGLLTAMKTARSRLDQLMPLGYSIAGRVLEVGQGVDRFGAGDRVVCAGAGQASHAEVVAVPVNLTAPLDEKVDFESGAFTTLGAVALHGVHLAEAQLGEVVVVIGLGLLGQLTVQLLKSAGCMVAGMDIQSERAEQARSLGADVVATDLQSLEAGVAGLSNGLGADAVLITADTSSDEPIATAAEVARDRAIVVAVGNVGVNVPRRLYYEKELQLRISRSYGPGRYDPRYEEQGVDYPVGYVRWTENRNMEAVVRLLADGKIDVHPLISHRVPLERAAEEGYGLITGKAGVPYMGVIITYPDVLAEDQRTRPADMAVSPDRAKSAGLRVGLVGAGAFATSVLLPAMKKVPGIELVGVCSGRGMTARQTADRFNFQFAAADLAELLGDPTINTIAIATRHDMHASQASAALAASKHVFVEKPLALDSEELLEVAKAWSLHPQVLSVGYNRRFSGLAASMKTFLEDAQEPLVMQYRVNAGQVPIGHWIQDPEVGGGRIIGEVCHFVDLLTFLVGSLPVSVSGRSLPNRGRYADDNLVATIQFADGSIGEIVYVANGDKAYPKERLEVFGGGSVALLDDFRVLQTTRSGRTRTQRTRLTQDKGHTAEWRAFVGAVQGGGDLPISWEELLATSLTTFAIRDSLRDGQPRQIDAPALLAGARSSAEG